MDKIYRRKRIILPSFKKNIYKDNKNIKKAIDIILILSIGIATFYNINNSIEPIFEGLCIKKARAISTIIVNEESSKVLDNIDYENLVYIIEDENQFGNILKTDVVKINRISSEIAERIEKRLQDLKNQNIEIPLGALLNNKYFSGIGPSIKINIISSGNVFTEIKTEFEEKGINQTTYRVYLEIVCKVDVLTSYDTYQEEIINQVLLVETVIVGDVPNSYYNLENVSEGTAIELIE